MKWWLVWLAVSASVLGQDAGEILRAAIENARERRFSEAERLLLEGRKRFPLDNRFLQELAGVAYRRNDPAAAKGYLMAALRHDPRDAYAAAFLGSLFLMDDNLPAALKYWNRDGKPVADEVRLVPEPALDPMLRDRALAISAGQVVTPERLLRTERNLASLGIFADCRFELVPRSEDRAGVVVRLPPKALPVAPWVKLLAALRGLPYEEVHLEAINLRREAINFTSLWRWDPVKRRIALDLSGPAANWRFRWLADARDETWDVAGLEGVKLDRIETGADLSRILGARLTWTPGFRVAARRFGHAPADVPFLNAWTAEIRNRFDWFVLSWPERRLRFDATGLLRTGRIESHFPSRLVSTRAGLEALWFPQAKGDTYSAAAGITAGGIYGNAPLDELFMLGMERDNDLWLRGHVGTREGRKGSAPIGSRFLLTHADVDRRVLTLPFLRLRAGPFFDTGRVNGPIGSHGWLYDTGVQAKLAGIGGLTFTAVYGRNLRDGGGVFYTAIGR